jgi:hypothetical protein
LFELSKRVALHNCEKTGDLREFLPKHKKDVSNADRAVSLGYPAIAPILPELFEWLRDCNWPVSRIIAPFLASIGEPVIPEIRIILQSDDDIWKYWVLEQIVAESTPEVARGLYDELIRIVTGPTLGEVAEDVAEIAQEILEKLENDEP